MAYAQETEKEIKAVQGELSDSLIEVYSLYSFIGFQQQNAEMVLINQRKATDICERCFGEMSQVFLKRLLEQLGMEVNCGVSITELIKGYTRAATIAREVLTELDTQPMKVEILESLYGLHSQNNDVTGAMESVKELVEVYRPLAAEAEK